MKHIFLFITFCIVFSCKAQSPVVGLDSPRYNAIDGTYFKDMNNELDKFTGTWKYTNGTTEFVLEIGKVEQLLIINNYRDYLKAEYSYKIDGVAIVNTLPLNLNQEANIGGSTIIENHQYIVCENCAPNERRIKLYFNDPEREYLNSNIILRYMEGDSPEQITVIIYARHGSIIPNENSPTVPRVPYGEYVMIKQ